MKTFAVVSEDTVTNLIVANSREDAELVSGAKCVEYTEENRAYIGGKYDGTKFYPVVTPIADAVNEEEIPTE